MGDTIFCKCPYTLTEVGWNRIPVWQLLFLGSVKASLRVSELPGFLEGSTNSI